jgi:hypothetical protein
LRYYPAGARSQRIPKSKSEHQPQPIHHLSRHARVATAVLAFVIALIVRPVVGKNRFTGVLISVTKLWFAINVLVAAYS